MDVYENFLRLVALSDVELPEMLPRWKNACQLLELSEEDVRFAAEEWLPKYWDMSLLGVRKSIGAYIRELIEITRFEEYKQRGDKILYCNVPAHTACVYANKLSGGEHIHVSCPDNIISTVLNAFFHKKSLMQDPAKTSDNPLCSYCGVNHVKVAARDKGILAIPDVMWNWGLFCDESHKADELLHTIDKDSRWNNVLITMPKDCLGNVPETQDSSRVKYLACQLRDGQEEVSRYTGIQVREEHVIRATEEYLDYYSKVGRLTELVACADPQPISGNDLILFSLPSHVSFDSGYALFEDAIDVMIAEVEQRIAEKTGPLPANSPKLACQFIPFCVPWINRAFADNGVNLSINTFFADPAAQQRYFDPENIYESIARQWFCNPSAVNTRTEAEITCDLISRYPLDGVLYGFFSFECWIGLLHKTLVKIVEEKTRVPHYYLEGDFWKDEGYTLNDKIDLIRSIAYKVKINHVMSGSKNAKKKVTQR